MTEYEFTLILPSGELSHEEILDVTDALGAAGCTDASIRGHAQGLAVLFDRGGETLQAAIASAIADVERAGFQVKRVELEREAIIAG